MLDVKLSKKEKNYASRVKRMRAKQAKLEEAILICLEDRSFKQACEIHEIIKIAMSDIPSRHIMRTIYKLMHVDTKWLPDNPEDDLILL